MRVAIRKIRLIKSEQLDSGAEAKDYSCDDDRRGHSVILKAQTCFKANLDGAFWKEKWALESVVKLKRGHRGKSYQIPVH